MHHSNTYLQEVSGKFSKSDLTPYIDTNQIIFDVHLKPFSLNYQVIEYDFCFFFHCYSTRNVTFQCSLVYNLANTTSMNLSMLLYVGSFQEQYFLDCQSKHWLGQPTNIQTVISR